MAGTDLALDAFVAGLPFPPDEFQHAAFAALVAGESVVVAAPTGAGKTLVAEAAIHLAIARGERAFYTTPLKALSNQKFGDFRQVYGDDGVGLLTGDNSVNGDAPVVVMTTEVLRNMIYADSEALDGLGVVVLDEVHYLQDRFRGMVWEEVIIHLPREVRIVALSATVSNAGEFTDWVVARRGPTRLVEETHRPVPLESLYLLKDRSREDPLVLLPVFSGTGGRRRPNPAVERMFRQARRRQGRFRTPRRWEVAALLDERGLLPAIYFIFSRAGCEAAADQVASGTRLTDATEAAAIRDVVAARTAHLPPVDLAVLGYDRWEERLARGIAAHHAGMVPAFKEAVEELFQRGLVKLVFATETLSLGINMPARTVVLENLSKFTGESHELLRPGDYTQLTGRAGRRGIDVAGTAVVLYSRFVPFDRVAGIAAAGSHPLQSAFRPNYNMAANLIANYARDEAERLVDASFGQFRRQRREETFASRIAELAEELTEARRQAECERGDIWDFLAGGHDPAPSHRAVMRSFAQELSAGDVLEPSPGGRPREVMLARGFGSNPRMLLLSTTGSLRRVDPKALPETTVRLGSIDLPPSFAPREKGYQQEVAARLRAFRPEAEPEPARRDDEPPGHPVAGCPRLDEHRTWARRAGRLERELTRVRSRSGSEDRGMLAEFRRVVALLEEWGYADGWKLSEAGEQLRRVYNERDLLVAEAVRTGLLSGLDPPGLAAVVSTFVFDPRRDVVPGRWPNAELRARWDRVEELATKLAAAESRRRLPETPPPEPGFAEAAYYWAAGVDLEDLLDEDDLAAGDFVRTCRQLLDLLIQLRDGFPTLAETAAAAAREIDRGVVAAGGRA